MHTLRMSLTVCTKIKRHRKDKTVRWANKIIKNNYKNLMKFE